MARIRGEEEWARRCIATALGARAEQHDDGSEPGMYDVDILYPDGRIGALEITAAADGESIKLWKLVNRDGLWTEPGIAGGWFVALLPRARARDLRERLPSFLRKLEDLGVGEIVADEWATHPLQVEAAALGITHAGHGGTSVPGSIYFTIELPPERSGGVVPETGHPLAEWIGPWIGAPRRQDVLAKLDRSGAQERHAFVIVPGLTEAPFPVQELLMRPDAPAPSVEPKLPSEVTHVWAVSTWDSGVGFRWSPDSGWAVFDKLTRLTQAT